MTVPPPSLVPSPWQNQPLALYHGTLDQDAQSIISSGIDRSKSRTHLDFGIGFYTTTSYRQAVAWAWQTWERQGRRYNNPPAIVRFDVDRDRVAQLDWLVFVRGSLDADDFWSFIFYCRTGGAYHGRTVKNGWYDVVAGPVAASSWRQRFIIADADQVSFHTNTAVNLLKDSNPRRFP